MYALVQSALRYQRWGYSVIPVQANKKSVVYWKPYQARSMTPREIRRHFNHPLTDGIAVVTGAVSDHLEVIDIDAKNDLTGQLMSQFVRQIRALYPDIYQKLVIAATRNKGFHLLYKCAETDRCQALARRPTTEQERLIDPHQLVKVLIETRANGGYALIHPSSGYRFLRGDMSQVTYLSGLQRGLLLDLARTFNAVPVYTAAPRRTLSPVLRGKDSPLDDFDARGDLNALLMNHGWKYIRDKNGRSYYRRPGETDHDTSGDFHHQLGLFMVFSTSTEFIPKKAYRPHAVYAYLECDKDFSRAAKQLVKAGYGTPYWVRGL